MKTVRQIAIILALIMMAAQGSYGQNPRQNPELDARVRKFLDDTRGTWYDMNVPYADGQKLFDIIVQNNYTSALEIGTSTGLSGIWIAWALSKTGGKLITVDLDRGRHERALENFRKAGLVDYIDARLANAHDLVPQLDGPFDFVFSDADKDWYRNYFIAVDPKLKEGGCYVTHNISEGTYRRGQNNDYLQYLRSRTDYETTVFTGGGGMSISYKRSK
ncbi:MAG: class I SAM-dependent methyltransferase [Bacteroidales bacterium]|jgi:predicted O-methyltransferase YrrM|nr:class I SAM-dependent methyltransferase [Bacteroidales bacterium]